MKRSCIVLSLAGLLQGACDGGTTVLGRVRGGPGSPAHPIGAPCEPVNTWYLDFSTDPSLVDWDKDGRPEWSVRGGKPFPVQDLRGGVWETAGELELDSASDLHMDRRTTVHAVFQALGTPPAPHLGALVWLNLDTAAAEMATVFAELVADDRGLQRLTVTGWRFDPPSRITHIPLATFADLPAGMVHLDLDIDVAGREVEIWLGGASRGRVPIPPSGPPNSARMAVSPQQVKARFDEVAVQMCR